MSMGDEHPGRVGQDLIRLMYELHLLRLVRGVFAGTIE